jgi:hypothetical protein
VAASPEERFAAIAKKQLRASSVTAGTGFGRNPGLRVAGKIFAMLVKEELVVKLPGGRVAELSEAAVGSRFDPGHGRLMKEWLSVPNSSGRRWPTLVDEAREFVRPA